MSVDPLEKARSVKRRHERLLLKMANVVGVGVGYKQVAGRPTDEVAIVVSVSRKLPVAELRPGQGIPYRLEGVPVDVVEVGTLHAL
jgi:hypothetical protein